MALYKVTLQDRRGRFIKTQMEADDEARLKELAYRRGKLISYKKKSFVLEFAMTPAERQTFLRNLATLLASAKGASDALRAIEYSFGGTIKQISARMISMLENGVSLIEAIEKVGGKKHFPETTIALIKAGERSGKTWKALQDAADFEMEMEDMKKGSNKQMIVAIVGFLFAMITTFGTTLWLKPAFLSASYIQMFLDAINLTPVDYLAAFTTWGMAVVGGGFTFLLLLGTVGRKIFPFAADAIILKIPFYSTLILARNNYITLYGLSLMMTAGISMERALDLASESASKGSLQKDLKNAANAVRKGEPWAPVMSTFQEVDRAALDGAVDKSQIGNILYHLARNSRDTFQQVSSTIGPSLQMLAALFVILSGAVLFGYTMLPLLQASAGAM